MDPNFDRILDNLPEKRSRSRLEPYAVLIRELLRRHRTYREIASVLLERFQLHTSISTIHDFVRRWMVSGKKVGRNRIEGAQQNVKKDTANTAGKMQMPNVRAPDIIVTMMIHSGLLGTPSFDPEPINWPNSLVLHP